MKTCNTCKLQKSLNEFNKSRAEKDRLQRTCRLCGNQKSKKYQQMHKDQEKYRKAKWYQQNKEKVINAATRWNFANRTKINARKYKRYRNDVNFKIADILRSRVAKFLKNGSAFDALGCTLDQFKNYLESKFQPGMTWDNWSKTGWHIDHIRPLSSFDLTDPVQFAAATHYSNLQPLWAKDNLAKGAK